MGAARFPPAYISSNEAVRLGPCHVAEHPRSFQGQTWEYWTKIWAAGKWA